MNVLYECPQLSKEIETVITIGTFDGVHKGHQTILHRLQEVKQSKNLKSIVFTFHPHPRKIILSEKQSIKILTTPSEKIQLLQSYNIDYLIFCPFTKEFANIPPEDFVHYLSTQLNIKHIIIGYDHKFGKDRKGDINTFYQLKDKYHFEVEQIPAKTVNEINISSTKIRQFLLSGDIENANELLGYNYFLSGTVIEGKKLGRTIGIPTANIKVEDEDKLIPANGVYCVNVNIQNKTYKGALNIGTNPTTDSDNSQKIEVHILNFNEDIYHQKIQISFLKKIRDEEKFDSIESLKNQILQDIEWCK
jgi:riboflavin kinase/FMN adenylyltransferase